MKQLGFVKKEYLDNPFDMITIYKRVEEMAKFNIREQGPQKYKAVKAEQDKLSAICGVQMKIARICPYCGHTVSIVFKGNHFYTQEKCSKCGETVTFPPISFRRSK